MSAAIETRPRGRSRRSGAGVTGVLGEILLTLGVVVLLFVVWQLWIGDLIIGAQRNSEGQERLAAWAAAASEAPTPAPGSGFPGATPTADPPDPSTAEPVVLPVAAEGTVFGVMQVPRWGSDYAVDVAGGVSRPVTLDPIGIGHYPDTPMPGDIGNVALAAHRTTYGKPFNRLADLRVGDAVVIATADGWYTYRFRTLEYVTPDAVEVLLPVPQAPGVSADGRYLTMTSCSPMYQMTERIVAYSVFESFTPIESGPPVSLTGGVA